VTAFDEAVVRAFIARTQFGDDSLAYHQALDAMEVARVPRYKALKTCSRCGRPGHNVTTCENLGGDR
jgi:hypothetical protein